jgi:hypothetical protein
MSWQRAVPRFQDGALKGVAMAEAATITGRNWRSLALIAAVAGVLIAGTMVLWAYYGTAVFFEMIAAGIAMCL